jgi:hypothetical protein
MKLLALLPCVSAVDDSSTLLSLKVQTTLESGVDHLLDAVGSRNVTQMASLLQNLVEDTIGEGPYELDGDVSSALDVIKRELIGDIRGALNEAHCYAQSDLHTQMFCFESCEKERVVGAKSCGHTCDGKVHKQCRDDLLVLYKTHIEACQALDSWVPVMPCPVAPKKCCLLAHSTWNCGEICSGTIKSYGVDDGFGTWLSGMISTYEGHYKTWVTLHSKCAASYKAYVEKDATCDCEQARCETENCKWDSCHFQVCEDEYQRCWARCQGSYESLIPPTECQEKDRKIDWSATEKIECYVNVLLEKPTPKELLDTCGSETCYNQYREEMYNKCNTICVEVDFTNEKAELDDHARRVHEGAAYSGKQTDVKDQSTGNVADQDVTAEGVNSVRTKHRSHDGLENGRCTSHLDIDYLRQPPCLECEERPSKPCEESEGAYTTGEDTYMWLFYDQYDFRSTHDIKGFNQAICHVGEHTLAYAYNLCPCLDCEPLPKPPPQVCTKGKGNYDYSVHEIKVDCGAISKSNPTYGGDVDQ